MVSQRSWYPEILIIRDWLIKGFSSVSKPRYCNPVDASNCFPFQSTMTKCNCSIQRHRTGISLLCAIWLERYSHNDKNQLRRHLLQARCEWKNGIRKEGKLLRRLKARIFLIAWIRWLLRYQWWLLIKRHPFPQSNPDHTFKEYYKNQELNALPCQLSRVEIEQMMCWSFEEQSRIAIIKI